MKNFAVLVLLLLTAPLAGQQSFKVQVSQLKWQPVDIPGMPKGLLQRVLHDDKQKQLISATVKYPKGFREPRHYHTTCGHSLYILKGKLKSPEGDLTPGTFVYSAAKERHGPFVALEETVVLFYTDGPFDFIVEDAH